MSGIVSVYYDILDKDGSPIDALNPGDAMFRKYCFSLSEIKELEKMYIGMIEKIDEMTQFGDNPVIQKPESVGSDVTDPLVRRKPGRPRKVQPAEPAKFTPPEDSGTSAVG